VTAQIARAAAALAAALVLAVAVAGCSLRAGESGTKTTTVVRTEPSVEPTGPVKVQKTRVRVVSGIGSKGGFDAPDIYHRLSPGVVTVSAEVGGPGKGGLGSGFVLDAQGYVATNAHVVRGDPPELARPDAVYVSFADGNRVPAKVVGDDLNADVALLKVNPAGLNLTPLRLGVSRDLVVGTPVAAIGSPFGQDQSLSVGVISATGRDIDSLTQFKIGNAIQTDAAINHGNSGGPLIDSRGQVIGINSQIESTGGGGEGVGFAVPVDTVKRSLGLLREQGHVDYAYLGVSTQDLYPQLARRLGFSVSDGALVASVESGGPADDAGLKGGTGTITFETQRDVPTGGDVIIGIDGKPVHHSAELTNEIGLKSPGDKIKLLVINGKHRRTLTVMLAKRPEKPAAALKP
jgi:S1-C subfamily serine protease